MPDIYDVSGIACVALVLAVLFILVSTVSIIAELRHTRLCDVLSSGWGSDLSMVSQCFHPARYGVPSTAHLPSPAEQALAYKSAQEWVAECHAANVLTWVVDETWYASFDGRGLYPWSRACSFAYLGKVKRTPKDSGAPGCVNVSRRVRAPALETYTWNTLQLKRPVYRGVLRGTYHSVSCNRRDVLDRFRLPMRRADTFQAFLWMPTVSAAS
jgi:hypothetical protein